MENCSIKLGKDKQLGEAPGMLGDRITIQTNCEKLEKSPKYCLKLNGISVDHQQEELIA